MGLKTLLIAGLLPAIAGSVKADTAYLISSQPDVITKGYEYPVDVIGDNRELDTRTQATEWILYGPYEAGTTNENGLPVNIEGINVSLRNENGFPENEDDFFKDKEMDPNEAYNVIGLIGELSARKVKTSESGVLQRKGELGLYYMNINDYEGAFTSSEGEVKGNFLFGGYAFCSNGTTQPLEIVNETFTIARPGDANLDGEVDNKDFAIVLANYGSQDVVYRGDGCSWYQGDFNYDGMVDLEDFNLIGDNWTGSGPAPTSIPEPTTIMYGLVGVGLLAGRKKGTQRAGSA
ncbi:MAG: hypothetical protein ACP5D2_02400 [Candidatus Nanoarchaeia archaeon]